MPSSQLRKGLRQLEGEISERAAIAENAKSIGRANLYWKENDLLCHRVIQEYPYHKANLVP
jgi:hypothetical protein